jgi:phosphohistidine phosphatase SixA
MLEWLYQGLLEVEKNNGTAILVGHVPNLEECGREFGRRLHAIIDRF